MQHRRSLLSPGFHSGSPRHVAAAQRRPPSRGSRPPARRSAGRGTFHAPSFSAGVVMGAVVVLGAAYLPELAGGDTAGERNPDTTAAPAARPQLTFEFDDLLRNSRVTADPEPYLSEPEPGPGETEEEIMLQAASFRSRDDAERLRAALLLMDLPAATRAISLDNGAWYRVTVGPFDSRVQAQRALTRLREKNIAALWTTRSKDG